MVDYQGDFCSKYHENAPFFSRRSIVVSPGEICDGCIDNPGFGLLLVSVILFVVYCWFG